MKAIILLVMFLGWQTLKAQSTDEAELVKRTYLLSHTIFGTKDSITLERLFASTATYGHSHGKLQSRSEAITGAVHNQSTYTDTTISNVMVIFGNPETAIVRYLFKANEHTKDGNVVPLNFTMMLVWVKEKKEWKLFGRQAASLNN